MILCIQNVLSPDVLGEVNAALEAAAFVEGRVTASEHAKLVKNNLQTCRSTSAPRATPSSRKHSAALF